MKTSQLRHLFLYITSITLIEQESLRKRQMNVREFRLQFVVAFALRGSRAAGLGRRKAKQMPLEAANSSYFSGCLSDNSEFL